jgi:hypothetical protein
VLDDAPRVAQQRRGAVGEVNVRKQRVEELVAVHTLTRSNWRQYNQQERQKRAD